MQTCIACPCCFEFDWNLLICYHDETRLHPFRMGWTEYVRARVRIKVAVEIHKLPCCRFVAREKIQMDSFWKSSWEGRKRARWWQMTANGVSVSTFWPRIRADLHVTFTRTYFRCPSNALLIVIRFLQVKYLSVNAYMKIFLIIIWQLYLDAIKQDRHHMHA